jgi:hypothetical protein
MRTGNPWDEVVTEVVLLRARFQGGVLLVEGDTDSRLFKKFSDKQQTRIIPCQGRVNVLLAIQKLTQENVSGVAGVVDADFSRLRGTFHSSPHVLLTDTHDAETMMISSSALDDLLLEKASDAKLTIFADQGIGDVRNLLLSLARDLGYLRLLSADQDYQLDFEDLSYSMFIDKTTLELDRDGLLKAVKNKSKRHDLSNAVLLSQLEALYDNSHDLWQVCCGHDMLGVLGHALLKAIGSQSASDVHPDDLGSLLRASYHVEHFQQAQLYQDIKSWEHANPPYRLLKV